MDLELAERIAVPLSLEAFRDLVDHWQYDTEPNMSPPLCLGWDIRRQWPNEGFAIWRDLMHQYEPPLLANELLAGDPRKAVTPEKYEAALVKEWAGFARPKHSSDALIVDSMQRAREHEGWLPAGMASEATEAVLDDLAARCGAKRAAVDAIEKANEAARAARAERSWQLDDAGYEAWYLAGEPDGRGLKFKRWKERKLRGETALAACRALYVPAGFPMPSNAHIAAPAAAVKHEDFWAYSPSHSYIFVPTGEHWPASTVNARLPPIDIPMRAKPMPAAMYLDQNRSVEQATWAPGQPQIIENRLIADGGWIDRTGCKTFNLYRPPTIKPKSGDAAPWINHIRWIYPDEADHIIKWLAQRVQRPDQKINHALVLGGNQGIGKDTLLEPIKAAVGPWNCSEVSPQQVLGRFNSFVKSVILRISEARDLGRLTGSGITSTSRRSLRPRRTCCGSTKSTFASMPFSTFAV